MTRKPLPAVMPSCEVDGCSSRVWQRTMGKFLCVSHAQRFRKYGDPLGSTPRFRRKAKWIEQHVSYSGDDCLKWPFCVSSRGRGTVQFNKKSMSAPRAMCILAHGEPPEESYQASHSCGKGHEGCMNPRHLSWKTAKENEADKLVHGTLRRGTAINTSKLTEDDVRQIRKLIGKVSGVDIANAWGITPTMVSSIKLGNAWAWLE